MTEGWTPTAGSFPTSPANPQAVTAYRRGILDVRWDDPSILGANASYSVVGVNIYRSDDTEMGPYRRINPFPVSSQFYRDFTDNTLVSKEIVRWSTDWLSRGDAPNNSRYTFRTTHPIMKREGQAVAANSPSDVSLSVDGMVIPVHGVFGSTGEITLINQSRFDPITEKVIPAVLPDEGSEVLVTYYTTKNLVQSGPGLGSKSFYRLTTVALAPETPSGMTESDLSFSEPFTLLAVETIDYIWREGIRRNNWILEQGGERVKLFVKKSCGIPCYCTLDERQVVFSGQPVNSCRACFGTGVLGGYEGPYEAIIGPDDGDRRIVQTARGRSLEHSYEVFTGPSPMLTHRDFLVKQTNERYSIGAVRKPSARGNILQQHFTIAYLDENDIRYQIPVDGTTALPWPECRITGQKFYHGQYFTSGRDVPYPLGPSAVFPATTEKSNIPDDRELRGRTATWENQNYVWPILFGFAGWLEAALSYGSCFV